MSYFPSDSGPEKPCQTFTSARVFWRLCKRPGFSKFMWTVPLISTTPIRIGTWKSFLGIFLHEIWMHSLVHRPHVTFGNAEQQSPICDMVRIPKDLSRGILSKKRSSIGLGQIGDTNVLSRASINGWIYRWILGFDWSSRIHGRPWNCH